MARIIYSGLVESIRGSIGGTTFQANAYGYTVKRKPNMIRPASAAQNSRKAILSKVTREWRELTQSKRDEYNSWASTYPQYAKHNPESQLSGYAVFVKYNAIRVLSGGSIYTGVLYPPSAGDTIDYLISRNGAALELGISSLNEDSLWTILFFISRVLGASQNFIGTVPRYFTSHVNDTDTVTITTLYTDKYGSLPGVGDYVALDALLYDNYSPKVLARDSQIYAVGGMV